MLGNIVEAVGEMHAFVRWRPFIDRQSRPPFLRRPDRPWDESATAVWAHIVEFVLDAVRTERALITADARVHRTRPEVLVAIFAVRPELQRHRGLVDQVG